MIHFIAHHWVAAIVLAVAISFVAGVFAYAMCQSAGYHDEPNLIEPGDLSDKEEVGMQKDETEEFPCSWCQREKAIRAQPHQSHGICERHKEQLLAESKRFGKSEFARI